MGVIFEKDTDDLRRYLSEVNSQMAAFDRDLSRLNSGPEAARPTAGQLGTWQGIYYGPRVEGQPIGWWPFYVEHTSLLTMPLVFSDVDGIFAETQAFEFALQRLRREIAEEGAYQESKDSPLGPDFDTHSEAKKLAASVADIGPIVMAGFGLVAAIAILRK